MGDLIFHTDDKGREELKRAWLNTGGTEKQWNEMVKEWDKSKIESLEEIRWIMSQPPHWGKRKPG